MVSEGKRTGWRRRRTVCKKESMFSVRVVVGVEILLLNGKEPTGVPKMTMGMIVDRKRSA